MQQRRVVNFHSIVGDSTVGKCICLCLQPPKPPRTWTEIRSAVRFGHVCPQPVDYRHYARASLQDEDCLYLNIFTPPEIPQVRNAKSALTEYRIDDIRLSA